MEFSDPAFLIIFVFLAFLLGLYFDKPAKGKNARSAREIQEENERLQTELEEATSAKESLEAELKELKQQTRKDGVQPESDIEQRNLIESVHDLKEQVTSLETFMKQLAEQNKSMSTSIDSLATRIQENQALFLEKPPTQAQFSWKQPMRNQRTPTRSEALQTKPPMLLPSTRQHSQTTRKQQLTMPST